MRKRFKELYDYNRRIKNGERLSGSEAQLREELLDEVLGAIDAVDDDYARLGLYERYINAEKWSDVAYKMGYYSDDCVRKICERTIKKLM